MTYPPAMMLRKTAAQYCDVSEEAFEREVIAGRLPMPVIFGERPHWHRATLDTYLDRIAGAKSDWRSKSPVYNPDLRAKGKGG